MTGTKAASTNGGCKTDLTFAKIDECVNTELKSAWSGSSGTDYNL